MKRLFNYAALAMLVGALTALAGLAQDKIHSAHFVFSQDVKVGDTQVAKGEYKLRFDEESGKLEVIKRGGDEVVATVQGQVTDEPMKQKYSSFETDTRDGNMVLKAVHIEGAHKKFVLDMSGTNASINQ